VDALLKTSLVTGETIDEELRTVAPGLLRRVGYGLPQALPTALGFFLF
jgi:hypothetical protein